MNKAKWIVFGLLFWVAICLVLWYLPDKLRQSRRLT